MWGFGEPGFHHSVDVGGVGSGMLAVHPLPVQSDAEFVHVHGGLEARCLRRLAPRWADCLRSSLTEARNDAPERPPGALDVTGHIAPCPLAQALVELPSSLTILQQSCADVLDSWLRFAKRGATGLDGLRWSAIRSQPRRAATLHATAAGEHCRRVEACEVVYLAGVHLT